MEDGWQKRQERQANRTHHRTLQMLRKDFPISVEQEENLDSVPKPGKELTPLSFFLLS
jgi:hypothetical protein